MERINMFSPTSLSTSTLFSEFHIILREDMGVIFHAETLSFFKVSIKTAHILQDIIAGAALPDCAMRYEMPIDEIEKFLEVLENKIERQAKDCPISNNNFELLGGRLILLVSQDCNLRCRYCNAGGGDYGQGRGLMLPAIAIQIVENFIQKEKDEFLFKEVEFFGGEPTLNLPAVRAVCQHLTQAYQDERIVRMPRFTLITNGMLVNDEFIQLVKKYNICLTFSIDGPQDLHDYYRVDAGGQGSYQRVKKGLKKLQKATQGQQPMAVEATVTRRHLDQGYSHHKLQQFVMKELDVRIAHLPLIECGYDEAGQVSEQERTQWIMEMQTSILDNLVNGNPAASVAGLSLLKKLISKNITPYFCIGIGIKSLTVNVDGAIYPCYQLMDSSFYMGQATEKEIWKTPGYQQVEQRMRANEKFDNDYCKICWARGVCNGCLGELYAQTGSIEQRIDAVCAGVRGGLEEVIYGLTKLRSDPDAWMKIIGNLKESANENNNVGLY
jgi:uncharacterized protein